MTNYSQITFNRNAVEPVACLKAGYELIKDQYWLFLGMAIVGLLIGSMVPLGILLGPMMCGLYLAFFKKRRGEPIEFGLLFKGFDYFGPSVVASLLHIVPIMAIIIPAYFLFYVGFVLSIVAQGDEPNPAVSLIFVALMILAYVVVILLVILISIGFMFAYPLIVDRGLPGFDAVKLSFRAALSNFWRLLGLSLLSALLGMAGILLCIVGVYLVLPISYAAIAKAYEQVFGLANPGDVQTNLPPPPPNFT
jgi:hypothetical protein